MPAAQAPKPQALSPKPLSPRIVFSSTDTIVAIATPAGRGGLGVVRLSGPDAPRIAGELWAAPHPLSRATRRSLASTYPVKNPAPVKNPLPVKIPPPTSSWSRASHDQRPTPAKTSSRSRRDGSPVVLAATAARGGGPGRAPGRARRVHPSRVPARQARSDPGRGGGRPDRRGHSPAGAHGLRSARGHADVDHRGHRGGALRRDGAPRGLAAIFRTRGITSCSRARPAAAWPGCWRASTRCWRRRREAA